MYDEALNKTLLIMEMAIKLKAELLNLPFNYTNAKGKVFEKKLVQLIDEVLRTSNLNFHNKILTGQGT